MDLDLIQDYETDDSENFTDISSESDNGQVDDILISINKAERIFNKNIKDIQKDAADIYYSNLSRIANKYMNKNPNQNDNDNDDDDDDSDVIDFSTLDFSKKFGPQMKQKSNKSITKTNTTISSSEEENSSFSCFNNSKNRSKNLVKFSPKRALIKPESKSKNVEKSTSTKIEKSCSKTNTAKNLYKLYVNNLINDDINFQRQCFENLIQLLSSKDNYNSNHILRYLTKQIKQNCGFLPPSNQQVYPICRFDSQSEPKFEFFIQSTQTKNIFEILENLNFKFFNESKLIYAYVFDYYQKHINEF